VTNAWSALAPCPRSGGLCVWGRCGLLGASGVSKLKIASWNINSVRARVPIVERFLDEEQPDILCLQETKAEDEVFPADLFPATATSTSS
jgi:hypothetical protein